MEIKFTMTERNNVGSHELHDGVFADLNQWTVKNFNGTCNYWRNREQ